MPAEDKDEINQETLQELARLKESMKGKEDEIQKKLFQQAAERHEMSESKQRSLAAKAFKAAGHKHPEAFCLMHYKCEMCNHTEILWNSRDGVTPFVIPCDECSHIHTMPQMKHIDFHKDLYSPLYQLKAGQRYFADMTIEKARQYAVMNVEC